MKEELVYFAWKFKFYRSFMIYNSEIEDCQILSPGIQNHDSGPDFTGAKIKWGNLTLVGNIEIDLKSSDWFKHHHHLNKAFNNVIFQVVLHYDKPVICEDGHLVPVIQIEIDSRIVEKYRQFMQSKIFIPCMADIRTISPEKINIWLGSVLIERLKEKSDYILNILNQYHNSWEDTFYQILARNFGFKVNADPFEWLAKSTPLKILGKHHHDLFQLESLLFGQAGFLEEEIINCSYQQKLKQEYQFLKAKYQIKPIEKHLWKFMRIRPLNFPTIRLSQFANLIYKSKSLFSKIIEAQTVEELKDYFTLQVSSFWNTHYQFEKETRYKPKIFGNHAVLEVIINTIIPILFVYGEKTGNELAKERAVNFLSNLKSEENTILKEWKSAGLQIPTAFYSQALIQQKKSYCSNGRCLECGIGIEIIKKSFSSATRN